MDIQTIIRYCGRRYQETDFGQRQVGQRYSGFISGGHKFSGVVAGSFPYVFLMLAVIAALWFWPEIALWLATTMRGK